MRPFYPTTDLGRVLRQSETGGVLPASGVGVTIAAGETSVPIGCGNMPLRLQVIAKDGGGTNVDIEQSPDMVFSSSVAHPSSPIVLPAAAEDVKVVDIPATSGAIRLNNNSGVDIVATAFVIPN